MVSDTWELRDPAEPCEHPHELEGAFQSEGVWFCWVTSCPGGRKVVLRKYIEHAEPGRHFCEHYGCRVLLEEVTG